MESYRRLNDDHDCSLDLRIIAALRAWIHSEEFQVCMGFLLQDKLWVLIADILILILVIKRYFMAINVIKDDNDDLTETF